MRVRKEWLEIIDEHKALWRRLVLPKPKPKGGWDLGGWAPSIVEMFDRKSNSSLKEVSMQTQLKSDEAKSMVRVLEKSKQNLRSLRIKEDNYIMRINLMELSWALPKLVECRIVGAYGDEDKVDVVPKNLEQIEAEDQSRILRILWCPYPRLLQESFPELLANLVSLGLESSLTSERLRNLIEPSSKTLKHLRCRIKVDYDDHLLSPVEFPNFEAMEIRYNEVEDSEFPPWIRVGPSLSTLICNHELYSSLPSVLTLSIDQLKFINQLEDKCPDLVELRVEAQRPVRRLIPKNVHEMLWMLEQRKRNAEAGMEIEGVKMVQLKRLLIDFSEWDQLDVVIKLKELVEEVADLSTTLTIEVEVEV